MAHEISREPRKDEPPRRQHLLTDTLHPSRMNGQRTGNLSESPGFGSSLTEGPESGRTVSSFSPGPPVSGRPRSLYPVQCAFRWQRAE